MWTPEDNFQGGGCLLQLHCCCICTLNPNDALTMNSNLSAEVGAYAWYPGADWEQLPTGKILCVEILDKNGQENFLHGKTV